MIFPLCNIPRNLRPGKPQAVNDSDVTISWLGTAAVVVNYKNTTLLIDPFVTRPGLLKTAFGDLSTDKAAVDRWVPKGNFIAVGHSHYDHLMDVPTVALRDGATVIGSESTAVVAEKCGVDTEKILTLPPEGGEVTAGDMTLKFVESVHGKAVLGRIPLPGIIRRDDPLPRKTSDYKLGAVYGIHIQAGDVSLYHMGSADMIDDKLEGLHADVLLPGLAGAKNTPGYTARLARLLKPSVWMPIHYDAFFEPLENPLRQLIKINMEGFYKDALRLRPGSKIVLPEIGQKVRIGQDKTTSGVLEPDASN